MKYFLKEIGIQHGNNNKTFVLFPGLPRYLFISISTGLPAYSSPGLPGYSFLYQKWNAEDDT